MIFEKQTHENLKLPNFCDTLPTLTSLRLNALDTLFVGCPVTPSGSRHIENPPKLSTDDDYFIDVSKYSKDINTIRLEMTTKDWLDCLYNTDGEITDRYMEEALAGNSWAAFRLGETNIILYAEQALYNASVAATLLCRKLNVKDKEQRIRIFRWLKFNEDLKLNDLVLSKPSELF